MKRIRFGPQKLKACERCYQKKTKCIRESLDQPCSTCRRLQLKCVNREPVDSLLIKDCTQYKFEARDEDVPSHSRNSQYSGLFSNSLQFYHLVAASINSFFEPHKEYGAPNVSANLNESFLDLSFLKRALKSTDCQIDRSILPPKITSTKLINVAYNTLSFDYQIMVRKQTYKVIDQIYDTEHELSLESAHNRAETVKFFLLLAFGRLYSLEMVADEYPGLMFFKYAMSLLLEDYDEIVPSYLESLVLIILYLIALNKLNHAYIYAGILIRCAYMLSLHNAATYCNPDLSNMERERLLRLWWTTYNIDAFISSCLGLPKSISDNIIECIEYPADQEYDGELNTGFFLAERVRLTKIKSEILRVLYSGSKPQLMNFEVATLSKLHARSSSLIRYIGTLGIGSLKRSTLSLALRLNECIILATAPFFLSNRKLHIKGLAEIDLLDKDCELDYNPEKIRKLSSNCVHAAVSNLKVLEYLFNTEQVSYFGFIDVNFLFFSSIILLLAGSFEDETAEFQGISENFELSLDLLREFTKVGGVLANDYLNRILILKDQVDRVRSTFLSASKQSDDISKSLKFDAIDSSVFNFSNEDFDDTSFIHFSLIDNQMKSV